jgi:hypothetical protein
MNTPPLTPACKTGVPGVVIRAHRLVSRRELEARAARAKTSGLVGVGGVQLSSLVVRIAKGETTGILRSQISGLRLLENTPRKTESTDRATPGSKAGALISDTTLVAPCASKASLVAKADCISAALDVLKSRNGGRANVARTRGVCIQPFSLGGGGAEHGEIARRTKSAAQTANSVLSNPASDK